MKTIRNVRHCAYRWPSKTIATIALAVSAVSVQSIRADALMTEPFDYNVADGGNLSDAGSPPWTATAALDLKDGNLTHGGLGDPVVGNNKRVRLTTSNGSHTRTFNGSAISSGSVYASFLLQIPTLPTTDNYLSACFALDNDGSVSTGSATGSLQARAGLVVYYQRVSSTTYRIGIRKNEGSATPSGAISYGPGTFGPGDTVLIVVKYTFNTGSSSDDTVTLWLNPTSLGSSEDGAPAVAATTSSGNNDSAPLQYVYLRTTSGGNGGAVVDIDNIRVGQTWADVTPSGVCTPAQVTSGASPASITVNIGSTPNFTITADGTTPGYDWQSSPDGNTWFPVSGGIGANTTSYTTAPLTAFDSGTHYRCVVTVPCNGSSATSEVAIVTVEDTSGFSYRSFQNGNWNDPATWQQSSNGVDWVSATSTPSSANSNIIVRAGHTVSVTAPVTVDDLVVEAGGQIDVSGGVFTVNDGAAPVDCDVSGTLQAIDVAGSGISVVGNPGIIFENGGRYVWARAAAGIIPAATWADGSTCEIANGASGTAPTGLNQSFYDFYWNWPGSGRCNLNSQLTTVRGDLTVNAASDFNNSVRFIAASGTCNLSVGGDVILNSGYTTLSGGSDPNTILNIYVGGNFMINAGANLDSRASDVGAGIDTDTQSNILFTNTASAQILTNAGGVAHTGEAGDSPINWRVNSGVTVHLAGNLPLLFAGTNVLHDSVIVDGTLVFNGNQLTGSGSGNLTVHPGGTVIGNGINPITTTLNAINFDGTLNLPGLPTFAGGESFKVLDAATYNITSVNIIPSTPPGATSWDTGLLGSSGILQVVGGGGPPAGLPRITSITRSGTDVVVRGTNGTHNGAYHVLAFTNPAAPLVTWPGILTNAFDENGDFAFTNAINSSRLFYIIQQQP